MTEAEWSVCEDPRRMFDYMIDRTGIRKLMLWGCACCERIPEVETTPCLIEVLRLAESVAEGRTHREALVVPAQALQDAREKQPNSPVQLLYSGVSCVTCRVEFRKLLYKVGLNKLAFAVAWQAVPEVEVDMEEGIWGLPDNERFQKVCREEHHAQATLARDIFGNPFDMAGVKPCWQSTAATSIARGIYHDRAFERMPVLADALQDAGCENEAILNHCRGSGPHVRGCWVVDQLLGKQ